MSFLNKILPPKRKERIENKASADIREAKLVKEAENRTSPIIGGAVLGAHVTEKTASRNEGTYVFKVAGSANKTAVKRAIENRFNVKVEKVRVLNSPGKERRRGRQIGWRSGFKKALVTLREGQTIEIQ